MELDQAMVYLNQRLLAERLEALEQRNAANGPMQQARAVGAHKAEIMKYSKKDLIEIILLMCIAIYLLMKILQIPVHAMEVGGAALDVDPPVMYPEVVIKAEPEPSPNQPEPTVEKKPPHVCPFCAKQLSRSTTLTNHIRTYHAAELEDPPLAGPSREYPCDMCTKTFGRANLLAKHKVRVHTPLDEPMHPCPFACGQNFQTSYNAKDHSYRCKLKPKKA